MDAVTLAIVLFSLVIALRLSLKWHSEPETKMLGEVTLDLVKAVFLVLLFAWYIPLGLAVVAVMIVRTWVCKKLKQLARHPITALPIGLVLGTILYIVYALYVLPFIH